MPELSVIGVVLHVNLCRCAVPCCAVLCCAVLQMYKRYEDAIPKAPITEAEEKEDDFDEDEDEESKC